MLGSGCGCGHAFSYWLEQRYLKPKRATRTQSTSYADNATHQLDELLGDRRAEARTAITPRRRIICLYKTIEYALLNYCANADPGVSYVKVQPEALVSFSKKSHFNGNFAPLSKFNRIRQKV
jgi:hypothetical protein